MKHLLLSVFTLLTVTLFAQKGNFKLDKEYTISKTGTIDLRSSDADVFITGSNRSTAHIKIERTIDSKGVVWGEGEFLVNVEEENGNLIIRERQENYRVGVIGYYREVYKIEIEVPAGVSLKINGDDGDYLIKNIGGAISLDVDDADAELRECTGNKFSFRLNDGDILMDRGAGELDVNADDADVTIRNANFSSIEADINDGDLTIETSLDSNGNYSLNSEDGSIVLKITKGGGSFDIRHEDGRVITEGNFSSVDRDEEHTRLSLANGNAKVYIRTSDGGVRVSAL